MRFLRLTCPFLLTLTFLSCTASIIAQDPAPFGAIDLGAPLTLDKLITQLSDKRVVFIGEIHTRYDHHLNQLEIIRGLYQQNPDMAIGVEYFQQPFQRQVDGYIAGDITEQEFLRSTEYFTRWGYDYRLYSAIFRYASEHHIPVVALNVPGALPSAVAKAGIAGLSKEQRAALPADIEPADAAYRARLRVAFEGHPASTPDAFNHFVEAQLVWDEGMAASAAAYLSAHPARRMAILAGSGHVAFGSGIPQRLERRTHAAYAIVLSSGEQIEPRMADYVVLSQRQELPAAGSLGVNLEEKNGECRIGSVAPGGAAETSGLRKGDVFVTIDNQPIKSAADVHLALWNKTPGERVLVTVRRNRFPKDAAHREFGVLLMGAPKTDATP
jgi:uncharacterized iron-regulated protein